MNISKPITTPHTRSSLYWPALIQLILSCLAIMILLGIAAVIIIVAVVRYFSPASAITDLTQPFMEATSLAFAGVLVIPSAWYAWQRLAAPASQPKSPPAARNYTFILTLIMLVVVGAALVLGNIISQDDRLSWFLLPPLNIIATGLPALWVIYIGTRGLIPGTPRRQWGSFASGLVLGPLIILVLELLLLVVMGILVMLWVMLNPALSTQLNGIAFRLQNAAPNTDAIIKILLPFLLNPGIIFLVFTFISVLVPVLEETFKPIGVWLMAGQGITPAQGFAYGVLSGAGFGLFENLGNTSGGGAEWAILASSRISTLLLHSFTAGLVGWALVSAWSQKRYLRLALVYALAVLIHGLWNGMAVLSMIPSLQDLSNSKISPVLIQIGSVSSYGIIALGVFVLVFYIAINGILRRQASDNLPSSSFVVGVGQNAISDTFPAREGESGRTVSASANSPSGETGSHSQEPDPATGHPTTGE